MPRNYDSLRKTHFEIGRVCDYLSSGTINRFETGAELGSLFLMAALVAPAWNTPIKHGPISQYSMLILPTGAGKEAYTVSGIRKVLKFIVQGGDERSGTIVAKKKPSSHVGLYNMLRKCPGLVITYDEMGSVFQSILSSGAASSSQLIGTALLESYMGPDSIDGTATKDEKNSTDEVLWPIPSIIGGMTIDSLLSISKLPAFQNDGLLGRFELVTNDQEIMPCEQDELKDGGPPSKEDVEILLNASGEVLRAVKNPSIELGREGNITFQKRKDLAITKEAKDFWWEFMMEYNLRGQRERGLFGGYISRMPQRVMRTASLLAFYRDSREVSLCDVEAAHGWHMDNFFMIRDYIRVASEPTPIEKICALLRDNLTHSDVNKSGLRRLLPRSLRDVKKEELNAALCILIENGDVIEERRMITGRNASFWYRKA
jgi:hypothetical protein